VIFHSLEFIVFLAVTLAIYWALGRRAQNVLLLVASYVFYGWVHAWFLALIAVSTIVDWAAALLIERQPSRKRAWLGLSLAANLGMLGVFKYFNFFAENVNEVLGAVGLGASLPALEILLPVGISFYTFQTLSYTIDVYRGRLHARRSLVDVAVFVAFFPQLVAGPIERATSLLPQVEQPRRFSLPVARQALLLVVWGYVQKIVVADNAGVIANKVFAVEDPGFEVLWAGVFAFAIQIYADFSAYSDIARGTARWFGFELMRNFDHPYFARGPADFWRRWHISLSTWFRDYVYIPLGGSRGGRLATHRNVLATFLISGLWHGASWNFVLWGLYHGLLVTAASLVRPLAPSRTPAWIRPLQIGGMFLLTSVGWLLFRETELAYLGRALALSPFSSDAETRLAGAYLFLLAALYSTPIWVYGYWAERRRVAGHPPLLEPGTAASRLPLPRLAWHAALAGLFAIAIIALRSRTSLDFIYFRF
jgi:D-alanyl-lipoteichoic acid acyltransferase DltB (MBOAT superfamily)